MIKTKFDIAVIGAGPAGVAAAFAAVSTNCTVALIEISSRLGGSVTAAMHRSLCGLYSHTPASPLDTLNAGAQREAISQMHSLDPSALNLKPIGKTCVLEFPAPIYEQALLHLSTKPNIQRMMNTRLTAVRREMNTIAAIHLESQWHEIKAVIDCTGSGALMQMLGEDVMHPPDPQRMLGGYSIRFTGLTGDAEMLRLQLPYVLAKAVADGTLPPEARFTMFHPGPAPDEGICKLAVNPERFATGEVQQIAARIVEHLRKALPRFATMKIRDMSPNALPRDGRRLKGKATVTEDDVLQGRQLNEPAVHAWWPIEQWDPAAGPTYQYPPPARHYDIPYEATQSAIIENLFAAGTCVSATATAAASLRASGICLATGHAAGLVAGSLA